jgi:hypothetical protein
MAPLLETVDCVIQPFLWKSEGRVKGAQEGRGDELMEDSPLEFCA